MPFCWFPPRAHLPVSASVGSAAPVRATFQDQPPPILIHVVSRLGRSARVRWRTVDSGSPERDRQPMNRIIYIIGLIVVIAFVLGFLGLR